MSGYDGPTLRAVRESMGVPLRRIARSAGMSHGHLSKVERGEYGRPVTPAIMAAYERVTGLRLAEAVARLGQREAAAGHEAVVTRRGTVWRCGQISDLRRRGYQASIGALSAGGYLGEPYLRLLDGTGRPLSPGTPGLVEAAQLERFTETAVAADLRYGGAMVAQLAKAMLRWAVPMLEAGDMDEQLRRRLSAAVGMLAHRAAWAAFDCSAHDSARSLFRLALYTAMQAGDADLRGHVLADVAAQHNEVGYPQEALEVLRFVEGDERVGPLVRMVIQGVKARAFAALGEAAACHRCLAAAEGHYHEADWPIPKHWRWVHSLCPPRHLEALTGHALADLAARTGGRADGQQAEQRLTDALDGFDPDSHARAHALCATRLARLLLDTGDLDKADFFARLALHPATRVRSARVARELAIIGAQAAVLAAEPVMGRLAEAIAEAQRVDSSGEHG